MPRRGTELETRFTGNDADLKAANKRSIDGAKRLGDSYEKSSKKAQTAVGKLKGKLDGLGKAKLGALGVGAIGLGALGVAKQRFGEQAQAAQEVDKMLKASDKVGADFEAFQRQADAARKAGVSNEQYFNTLSKLTRQIELAKNGNDGLAESFSNLGVDVDKLSGMKPTEQFKEIADAFSLNPNKDFAFSQLGKIIEDDAKQYREFFAGGRAGIEAGEQSVFDKSIVKRSAAEKAEAFLDMEDTLAAVKRANLTKDLSALKGGQKMKADKETVLSSLSSLPGALATFFGGTEIRNVTHQEKANANLDRLNSKLDSWGEQQKRSADYLEQIAREVQ